VRYDLRNKWHAMTEYRYLSVNGESTHKGFVLGIDRDINSNFRIGVGYSFANFSSDLTDYDYDSRGWFINMVGYY
jgi:hypothetical protein